MELRRRRAYRLESRTGEKRSERVIAAPSVLSFARNGAATIQFLSEVRSAAVRSREEGDASAEKEPQVFVDLKTITSISMPVAVILSAEFQRWSLVRGVQLRARRIKDWSPRVRRLFQNLGTFELLGIRQRKNRRHRWTDEVVVLPLQSGVQSDQEKVANLQGDLNALGLLFDRQAYIFDGLSEAVFNAIDHAYSGEVETEPDRKERYPTVGKRWWATSCYDPVRDTLRFFVYDQGVGIRSTLDKKDDWRPLIDGFLSTLGLQRTDAQIIEAAFEIGRTRTGLAERGKGLDQMASVARRVKNGYLRVLSGRGDVRTDGNGTYSRESFLEEVGGTLIEWSIPYGALGRGQDSVHDDQHSN